MKSLTIAAPAKVNLVLRVLNKRPDGYHDLFMIMEKLSLADDIFLQEIESGIKLTIEGESDSGMQAEKNLAYRAAKAFREAAGENRGVSIRLTKRIPIAAGLGGGSSDAAAVLRGLNQLWEKEWDSNKLAALGAKLGGDIPFFCFDGPAIVEGIGDRVTTLQKLPNLFFLLINPGFSVSTQWVYQEYDRLNPLLCKDELGEVASAGCHPERARRIPCANGILRSAQNDTRDSSPYKGEGDLQLTRTIKGVSYGALFQGFREVTASLKNDLERVTISAHPEINEIKKFLLDNGADGVLMSGSGPTVFGVFENASRRNSALTAVQKKNWKVFATGNISD
jgi:4-diphosphocytidyl-2-C-methyl-D-erythritol kinase